MPHLVEVQQINASVNSPSIVCILSTLHILLHYLLPTGSAAILNQLVLRQSRKLLQLDKCVFVSNNLVTPLMLCSHVDCRWKIAVKL